MRQNPNVRICGGGGAGSATTLVYSTVDRHEDFIQEPRISKSTLSSLQLSSVIGAELPAPLANGFV